MACRKLQLFLLLVAFQLPALGMGAHAEGFVLVAHDGYYKLDLAHIEHRGDTRIAWTRVEYEWDHFLPSNESYRSAVMLNAYHCSKRLRAVVSETLYEAGNASGRLVQHVTNNATELRWSPVRIDSIEARQLQ